jgi:hypothetical protein
MHDTRGLKNSHETIPNKKDSENIARHWRINIARLERSLATNIGEHWKKTLNTVK